MSACRQCLIAAFARAGVVEALESRGISVSSAGSLFELGPLAARELLTERGTPVETPELDLPEEMWTICRHCDDFPPEFTKFERTSDIPHVIFGVGRRERLTELADRPSVAIVGARRATAYGREVAWQLSGELAKNGVTVISGMALGIDGAAHRGAMNSKGSTIAVLAGSPDAPYPRSHRLLHEQIRASGCVISESPPGAQVRRWGFVARNRLIAALADLTVFVEGRENSGARHTVEFATELDLPVGAVPGPVTSPMSSGPNALLAEGAGVELIRSAEDALGVLGAQWSDRQLELPALDLAPEEARVFEALLSGARTPRELARSLDDLPPREIAQILGTLELAGHIVRTSSGGYERHFG